MHNRIATGICILIISTPVFASGDPAAILFPFGMLLALAAAWHFAAQTSSNWVVRLSIMVIAIAAMVPANFLTGSASAITYFLGGFVPGTVVAYITSRLWKRNKND